VALLLAAPLSARRQTGADAIKAAFLYNFTRFVEWPAAAAAGADGRFHVCVAAEPAFVAHIETMLKGEDVNGRPVSLAVPDPPDPARSCHLVYLGAAHAQRAARLVAALRRAPVLTVGEGAAFVEKGGMIAFILEDNRVKFDINKAAVDQAGLSVSSKLLRVARHVQTGPPR
jgi:hypothetical protein